MPTDSEIRRALRDNICRCTGYIQILESVDQAGAWIADPDRFKGWEPKVGGIRVSAVLVDGEASVKGELAYADDMVLPGMLHGQIVWSEYPHAKILSVDTSEARRSPGVSRVITSADVPGLNAHGRSTPDQAVFCDEYVRYTGDPIALVLAATKAQAVAAAVLVKVDYEELRGIHTTAEALADGAPRVLPTVEGKVCKELQHDIGDVAAAFAAAAHIVEGRFETQRQDHAYLEPLVCLAVMVDGVATVYTPTQAPFETREQLTRILDLPRDQVRVIATPLGGAFGGKLEITLEAMTAVAAMVTGRPIKITASRAETLRTAVKRHPYTMDYRVAVDRDGLLWPSTPRSSPTAARTPATARASSTRHASSAAAPTGFPACTSSGNRWSPTTPSAARSVVTASTNRPWPWNS